MEKEMRAAIGFRVGGLDRKHFLVRKSATVAIHFSTPY